MKIYSRLDTKWTYFEVWGGSTKHPDVRRILQSDKENDKFYKSTFITSPEYECFQWLVQCISELNFGTLDKLKDLIEIAEDSFADLGLWAQLAGLFRARAMLLVIEHLKQRRDSGRLSPLCAAFSLRSPIANFSPDV